MDKLLAFPSYNDEGMSLRDWFAGQALTICLKDMSKSYNQWAVEAYALASAMMAERERREKDNG
jgi:hypothetical protein